MLRKAFGLVLFVCLLSLAAPAQDLSGYLDVFVAKVRPEKRAAFDTIVKKMADANRSNSGDAWLASETIYGEGNTVYFTSARKNYAGIEQGMELFAGALQKAYGEAETQSLMEEFNSCVISTQSEIRKRRIDLSPSFPTNGAAYAKWVGESRWLRTAIVRIRPGRVTEYEAQFKIVKEALESKNPKWVMGIAQAMAGQQGTVFYITTLTSSLGAFDSSPVLRDLLGEEGFSKYLHTVAETVLSSETIINRFLPRLSNPPEEVAAAAPDFWKPAAPKPTTAP